jgi:hypothetical protein
MEKSGYYQKKKPHIYAYRRRKAASRCLEKLGEIVNQSSVKDCEKLEEQFSRLWNKMNDEKLHIFHFIPEKGEVNDKHAEDSKMHDVRPIARYLCPICKRPGYLYSPKLDAETGAFSRYIFHFSFNDEAFWMHELPPGKTKHFIVSNTPHEGFFIDP